jgi:hypothetical protein
MKDGPVGAGTAPMVRDFSALSACIESSAGITLLNITRILTLLFEK